MRTVSRDIVGPDAVAESVTLNLQDAYEAEANPLFVWTALIYQLRPTDEAQKDPPPARAVPAWCADYLYQTAWRLWRLARGIDYRDERAPGLSPQDAMKLTPNALELTRPGFNAFAAFESAEEVMRDVARFSELRRQHGSAGAALKAMMDELGIEEQPSMRRRLRRGRKLRGEG
ncbi:hypothetical protein J8J14_09535 [Roseomonas sp. SSH11]|uniref:Uncharacterized protein n=1 Tax=Pararoseomonas baculiformis TaxID=2820812 RepID=A0ABS4ADG4_9PROT|nr:hypothetical protein [Pararoseomonas baculiformis]MBP0445021.1 hypothetical protein [Pararoseomonas baculiformis]